MAGLVHQHGASRGESFPTTNMGESCFVDGPVGRCPGGPKRCIKAAFQAQLMVNLGPRCIPIPSHLLPGGSGAALPATHEQDESR